LTQKQYLVRQYNHPLFLAKEEFDARLQEATTSFTDDAASQQLRTGGDQGTPNDIWPFHMLPNLYHKKQSL
jgi:hypothetical protein